MRILLREAGCADLPDVFFRCGIIFVRSHFDLPEVSGPCPGLERFLGQFDFKHIHLAFSTAYPNNPASMFGHTFLRLSSHKKDVNGLFDYSISYAAHTPPGEGGVWFAVKGIFGGYRGRFSLLPYYVKLQQYRNMENRDIWEYRLNLSSEEIRHLLWHVWEIESNSYYDYYFFGENCAYHLLSLLEAVRPGLDLTDDVFFLSPPDAVKRVTSRGLVVSTGFRPSFRRVLRRQYLELDSRQKKNFHLLLKGAEPSPDTKPLNAVISYYHYKKQSEDGLERGDQKNLDRLLLARSRMPPEETSASSVEWSHNRPELGHDMKLLSFSLGHGQRKFFQEIYWRSAYHDLLAADHGYEPFSEIIFPAISFRYQKKRLQLEEINFARITSLAPITSFEAKLSWAMEFDLLRERNESRCGADACYTWNMAVGKGVAVNLFGPNVLFAVIPSLSGRLNSRYSKGYRLGLMFQSFFLAQIFENYKTKLHHRIFMEAAPGDFRRRRQSLDWGHSLALGRQTEMRLNYLTDFGKRGDNEIKLSFFIYH